MEAGESFTHFIEAQERVYSNVLRELAEGRKQSHWMWFIFPQVAGLGHSWTARRFALSSVASARRYADHPVVGKRLRACTRLVLEVRNRSAEEIFGDPDYLKFRSSMTLFALSAGRESIFQTALDTFYGGVMDERTLVILGTDAQSFSGNL